MPCPALHNRVLGFRPPASIVRMDIDAAGDDFPICDDLPVIRDEADVVCAEAGLRRLNGRDRRAAVRPVEIVKLDRLHRSFLLRRCVIVVDGRLHRAPRRIRNLALRPRDVDLSQIVA